MDHCGWCVCRGARTAHSASALMRWTGRRFFREKPESAQASVLKITADRTKRHVAYVERFTFDPKQEA